MPGSPSKKEFPDEGSALCKPVELVEDGARGDLYAFICMRNTPLR